MSLEAADGTAPGVGSSRSVLGDAFYPLFQRLFGEDNEFVSNVERKLAEARMAENVELYLSRSLAVGTISGLVLWLVGTFLGYLIFRVFIGDPPLLLGLPIPEGMMPAVQALKVPFLIFVTGLVFGAIGFALGFGALVSVPYFRANARKRKINILLPDAISYMYALSVGGLNQLEILEAIADAEDTYGEVSREFQTVLKETEYFDTDYRTAIRHQALESPSSELNQFFTDMLAIIDAGGDITGFLEDQKNKYMRTAKREQEQILDTLELFGEMYMTLSLFPLLLIIILVIMSMLGEAKEFLLYGTVYGLIPLTGVGFLVLVSTITQDTLGDGYIDPDETASHLQTSGGLFSLGLVERYTGEYGVFDRIKNREGSYKLMRILKRPDLFFRDHPTLVLAITVPISILAVVISALGPAPPSLDAVKARPVRWTFLWLYVPLYVNFVPLMIFYEWNVRSRKGIVDNLSESLRKLSSANETGMTLLESMRSVSETSSGKLANEFETIHAKVNYGTNLKVALQEFNNKYHIPRLARVVKLVSEAQEASSQIQSVLTTAAQTSENQDGIDRDRKARTRTQVVIILMTYLTLLGVMALLKMRFLDVMSGLAQQANSGGGRGPASNFGSNVDTNALSMLFFHGVTLQAILSGFIAGYIRDVNLLSGLKYVVILVTIALAVWIAISGNGGGSESAAAAIAAPILIPQG